MIEKFPGNLDIIFHCDTCFETKEFHNEGFFQTMMNELKAEGWKIKKVKGYWEHYCPECKEKKK